MRNESQGNLETELDGKFRFPILGPSQVQLASRNNFTGLVCDRGFRQGVEIGVYRGRFAWHLLNSCPELSLYLVDPWDGSAMTGGYDAEEVFREVQQLPCQFGVERVKLLRERSPEAAKHPSLCKCQFDFVYIDGDHSFEQVLTDVRAWWPLLRPGGVMAGHDYNNRGKKRVKSAVDSLFPHVNTTQERCSSWWVEKAGSCADPALQDESD